MTSAAGDGGDGGGSGSDGGSDGGSEAAVVSATEAATEGTPLYGWLRLLLFPCLRVSKFVILIFQALVFAASVLAEGTGRVPAAR